MDGAGNDFIVIDNRFFHFSDDELEGLAKTYCPRRTGIGADGLVALNQPVNPAANFRLRYFNTDGSGGMCGNGTRCLVHFAYLAEIRPERYVIETDSGLYDAELRDGIVALFVPEPRDYIEQIALADCNPPEPNVAVIWTGTEHAVLFVDQLDDLDVSGRGRQIRHSSALAPRGANVNFVAAAGVDTNSIDVRTYERGVEDETLACGTGALASAIVAYLQNDVGKPPIDVHMPGGTLTVDFTPHRDGAITNLSLSGPSKVTYRGSFQYDPTTILRGTN